MNPPPNSDNSKSQITQSSIKQQVDSAQIDGGIQGTQGNRNNQNQIQGDRNFILNFHVDERVYRRWFFVVLMPLLIGLPTLGFTLPEVRRRLSIELFANELFRPLANRLIYKDSIHNFAVEYPKNWTYQKENNPITYEVVSFIPKSEAEAVQVPQVEVIVTTENLSEPTTLSNYIDQFITQLRNTRNFRSFKLIKQRNTTFAKRPAYGFIYTVTFGGKNWKIMEVATIKGLQVYLVTYKAELSQYNRYQAIAQRMIHSFKILSQ